jgi:hypothetical protein
MHKHQLVLIRDPMECYKIYWCRDCGLIFEKFALGIYEMLPEWSRERLLKEDRNQETYTVVQHGIIPPNNRRLGRSLKDIQSPSLDNLAKKLFGGRDANSPACSDDCPDSGDKKL